MFLTGTIQARAQEPHAFVGGSFVLTQWRTEQVNEGTPSTTYRTSTTRSLLRGFAVDAGVFVTPHFAIGLEFSRPFERADVTSSTRYAFAGRPVVSSDYREAMMLGTVRGIWSRGSHAQAGVVGGAGLLYGSSVEQISGAQSSSSPTPVNKQFFGVMGGGEMALSIGRHLRIVPDGRFYRVQRDSIVDGGQPLASLGLPKTFVQTRVGLRVVW